MSFDAVKFEKHLRDAGAALDQATEMLDSDTLEGEDIAYPGAMYLLGRLEIAQGIVELELPEFNKAAMATVADMMGKE